MLPKHTIYVLYLCLLSISLKEAKSPLFPYLGLATILTFLSYTARFKWKELIPGTAAVLTLLAASHFFHKGAEAPKVVWIKEYRNKYKEAILSNWKFVWLKEGSSVEVGDEIDEKGKVLRKGSGLEALSLKLRYRLYRELQNAIDYPVSSLVGACTLGVRYELPTPLRGYFALSGLYHFLAISGLHVGIVIGALGWLLKLLKVPRPLTSASLLVLPLMPLTGLPPSALRAYLFMLLIAIGLEEFRKITPLYLLGVVFLITVLLGKFNLSAALSFSAVGGILLSVEGEGSKLEKSFKAAIAPVLFTLPIVLDIFGTVNLASFITTPVIGVVFTPFLISSFLSEVTLYKVELINRTTELLGEAFILGTKASFFATKWAVIHCELPLTLAATTMLLCLVLVLAGKVRWVLVPPALLLVYSVLNQTVVTGKELHLKGWKLNSFRFISTEGQRYRECEIFSTYVMPATRKLLFRNRLIDERLKYLEHGYGRKGNRGNKRSQGELQNRAKKPKNLK